MKRCPVCGYENEFGEKCPTCGVILVDAESGLVDKEQIKTIIRTDNNRSNWHIVAGIVAVVVGVFIYILVKNYFSKDMMSDDQRNVENQTIVDSNTKMGSDSEDFEIGDYDEKSNYDTEEVKSEDYESAFDTKNKKIKKSKYILKKSDNSYISESNLHKLSSKKLTYARNEIYARHGYIFNSEELTKYFSKKNWYHPNSSFNESSDFNKYEKYNTKFILEYQHRYNKLYKPK